MAKDDNYYLSKISENIDFIIEYMRHIFPAEFVGNFVLQDSMMFRLIQNLENADLNGALNILAKSKVVSIEALYIRGEVDTPERIRIA